MTAIDVATILGRDMGVKFRESMIDDILNYIDLMLKDHRIIIIKEGETAHALVFFSVTDDPDKYLKKKTWDFVGHEPDGKTVVIEQMISRGWNKELRKIMEEMFLRRYPHLTSAVWYRYAKWGDRLVRTYRRLKYV